MALELLRFRLAEVMRPLVSRLPRGRQLMYRWLLGPVGSRHRGDPLFRQRMRRQTRVFYDRHIQCYVLADVADWASRAHYLQGQYYDKLLPLLLHRVLSPSDTFVDVGANRGVHTLAAARYLERGRVVCFEPNPAVFRVLEAHLTLNALTNCTPYNIGCSDEPSQLEFYTFADGHSGACSFLKTYDVQSAIVVQVRRLDQLLDAASLHGRVLVKIDTEGFDHHVIKGMGSLLDHDQLCVLTEVSDSWLRKAGSSAEALFQTMMDHGFRAYVPLPRYAAVVREVLRLSPVEVLPDLGEQYDLVFAKPGVLE